MKMALDEGVGMDPRVGLGLSFWLLGDTKKGTLAWKRAIALVSLFRVPPDEAQSLSTSLPHDRTPRIEERDSFSV
jgi:hypothetical protein